MASLKTRKDSRLYRQPAPSGSSVRTSFLGELVDTDVFLGTLQGLRSRQDDITDLFQKTYSVLITQSCTVSRSCVSLFKFKTK